MAISHHLMTRPQTMRMLSILPLLLYAQSGLATSDICPRLRVEAPAAASCSCEGVYSLMENFSVPVYHRRLTSNEKLTKL